MLLRLLFRLSFGLRFCGLIVNVFHARAFIPLKTCYGYLFVNCYSLGETSKFNTFHQKHIALSFWFYLWFSRN